MTVIELPSVAAPPGPQAEVDADPASSTSGVTYDEVFTFHEGRLLLRGPNGSGKSKALELLLPFVLDANLRAAGCPRSAPPSGRCTGTSWARAPRHHRVGYVWLESASGGPGPDGAPDAGPLRARLRPARTPTTVHADYFTTSLRIAMADGIAWSTGRPAADQGRPGGSRSGNAASCTGTRRLPLRRPRGAVPGLAEQRYDALITALQLRTPKLSQRLDPRAAVHPAVPRAAAAAATRRSPTWPRVSSVSTGSGNGCRTWIGGGGRPTGRAAALVRPAGAAGRRRGADLRDHELDNLTRTARQSAEQYDGIAATKAEKQRLNGDLSVLRHYRRADSGLIQSEGYQRAGAGRAARQTAEAGTGRRPCSPTRRGGVPRPRPTPRRCRTGSG